MDEPTIVIHNYAGDSGEGSIQNRMEQRSNGVEVSRYTPDGDYQNWMWAPSPGSGDGAPEVDFKSGRTYVIYELPNG